DSDRMRSPASSELAIVGYHDGAFSLGICADFVVAAVLCQVVGRAPAIMLFLANFFADRFVHVVIEDEAHRFRQNARLKHVPGLRSRPWGSTPGTPRGFDHRMLPPRRNASRNR